ncbi:DUF4326 domain-containing protein [Actinomadura sp. 3N407]|uniref:DUF4326 domain-containing protein n=1 Tax=Actinomadura sp. 3N407 TaxID=3457423 RepID=UPI003FCE22D0
MPPAPDPHISGHPPRIRRTRRGYFTAAGDRYTGPVRYAGRPTVLGNPFRPQQMIDAGYTNDPRTAHILAVAAFRSWLTNPASRWWTGPDADARRAVLWSALPHLAQIPLACWCRPTTTEAWWPCHVDVLLELANPTRPLPATIAALIPDVRTPAPQLTHAIAVSVEATPDHLTDVFGPFWRQLAPATLCGRPFRDAGFPSQGGEQLDLVTCPRCVRSPTWMARRDPLAGQLMVLRRNGARTPVTVLGWEPPTRTSAPARRQLPRAPYPVGALRDVAVTTGDGNTLTVPWTALRRPRIIGARGGPRVAAQPWPATCVLQGGENGMVFTPDGSYETAYVEAFPASPATFLRGEGAAFPDAEADAWRRFQAFTRCRHTTPVDTRGRRNGYGICPGCGAGFSAQTQIVIAALTAREGAAQ